MKSPRLSLVVAAGALAFGCADDPLQPAAPTPDVTVQSAQAVDVTAAGPTLPSQHVIVFKGRAPAGFEANVEAAGGAVTLNHEIGIAVVSGLDDAAAAGLADAIGADFVEPMAPMELIQPAAVSSAPEAALVDASVEPASATNPAGAILFANQWNMHQIHAADAWAAGRLGSSDVTIAILDTGIDYMLPDLQGRVDLSRSVSFEPVDDYYAALYFPSRHPSTDLHYHGTNVATQASSNAWAFAGVTSQTTLMSVKVCSVVGGCHGVLQGLLHAIDNGADVINMSLGGWFSKAAFPGNVSAYNRIMNYAAQNGVTVVVSAGNDANDLDTHKNIAIKNAQATIVDRVHIPSFFATYCDATHVICVSSTRRNDVPAAYTNYGRSAIDVAAPGGASGDWVYSLCPQTSLLYNCAGGYYTFGVAGTSQAAPHVSGLAALAVEDVGRSPAQVCAYIRNSADAIGGGNTQHYGKGRINVARAVGAN